MIRSPYHIQDVHGIEYSVWAAARRLRLDRNSAHTSSGAGIYHSRGRGAYRLLDGTSYKPYTRRNAINVISMQRKVSTCTVRQNSSRPSHHQIRFAKGRTV